ncbi:hypothetical protein [Reinekea marinisedimentorum]|uniref:Scaffold protein FimL second domain-containing protein n=1 Tax=Reinekea marinisedimentorum TaxID=230495 RepID=A0A4R3IBH0_9GAMM|nr:hypothetical protein [Reinekea marinisedimentorum]TCS42621.1 hypothetical protein BCF53_103288 [Reinekea marinisedimentorum]
MSAIFSADAIKSELETTIQLAQGCLESYSVDSSDISPLSETQDYVRQLRGIFQVLEESGAVSVCDEMNITLNSIPDDVANNEKLVNSILEALSQTLVILSRFLDLISFNKKAVPSLLLPAINTLRQARKAPVLGEAHFFDFSFKPVKPPVNRPVRITRETLIRLKKFRHMYQAGLLHLIRNQRASGAVRYMGLALSRIDQLLGNAPCAPLWWVSAAAFEAMIQNDASMTPTRKRLFSLLDRELRNLIKGAPESLRKPSSAALTKEFLFLLALNKEQGNKAKQVGRFYKLPELSYSEETLKEQRQILFSPGQGVLASVSEALQEDINSIKDSVDQVARGGTFSSKDLHSRLLKVADVYVMLGLQSASNVLKGQAEVVGRWADNAAPMQDDLLKIADVVLYAESALSRLLQGQSQYDRDGDNKAFKAQLHEARIVLIDECESGLALAKRAISAYMDSGGDKLHLAKVNSTLQGVQGALVFLSSNQAAEIVTRIITFVDRELLDKGTLIDSSQLELLADALFSLEFYLEGLLNANENLDILKLAIHSLNSLKV